MNIENFSKRALTGAPSRAWLRESLRTIDWAWRFALTAALACAVWSAARVGVAAWYARRGSAEDLARAIQWTPDDAENYATLARMDELSGAQDGKAQALRLRQQATLLEPGNAIYRLERAMSEDETGAPETAGPDYLRARDLFPLSPDVNRELGEYYLRQWRIDDALDAMRLAIVADPEMRPAIFDELWRTGVDTREVLQRAVPPDRAALIAYLDALASAGAIDEAHLVWMRIQALRGPSPQGAVQSDAFQYVDVLIRLQKAADLETVWAAVAPLEAQDADVDRTLVSNGGFEEPMLNEGLDWRVIPVDGAMVSVDTTQTHGGAHSLRIDFASQANLAYQHMFEFVPVEADTMYDFSGYLRAQSIASDSGPRFELYDADNPNSFHVATDDVRGTTPWTKETLRFRTGAATRLLVLRVARSVSTSFDNRLSGTVWVDDVRLVKSSD